MQQSREIAQPRVKKRLPCRLSFEQRSHSGLILNLSQSGLYVQTGLPAEPGRLVDVELHDPQRRSAITLQGAVVWRRRVTRQRTGINEGGMGLRLVMPPAAYDAMMEDLLPVLKEKGPATAGTLPPVPPQPATPSGDRVQPAPALPEFIVRVGLSGSVRTRRMILAAASLCDARERAARQLEPGWCVLEVTARAAA